MAKSSETRAIKNNTPVCIVEKWVNQYFEKCYNDVQPPIISGLCVWLDISKSTFTNYLNDDNNIYQKVFAKAKLRIEAYNEAQLYTCKNTAGVIFQLKNNFGWVEKQEINSNVNTDPLKIEIIE